VKTLQASETRNQANKITYNEMPVQIQCTILDAWGWCTGTTQRDGMGREEGGGFRMGNTCIPVVDYKNHPCPNEEHGSHLTELISA